MSALGHGTVGTQLPQKLHRTFDESCRSLKSRQVTISGLSLVSHAGGVVSFLFLKGACCDFCSLGWAVMACQLLLASWLALAM